MYVQVLSGYGTLRMHCQLLGEGPAVQCLQPALLSTLCDTDFLPLT